MRYTLSMTFDQFLARVADAVPHAVLAAYAQEEGIFGKGRIRYFALTREHRLDKSDPKHSEPYDIVRIYHYYPDRDTVTARYYLDYGYGDFDPESFSIPVDEDWCDDL